MKLLRRLHLLAGCLFAPLLIYFTLSGAWQVLGWPDSDSASSGVYEQLSNPHLNQAWPGAKGAKAHSALFGYFAVAMSLGFCFTAALGIILAFRTFRPKWAVIATLVAGVLVPILFLYLAAHGKSG